MSNPAGAKGADARAAVAAGTATTGARPKIPAPAALPADAAAQFEKLKRPLKGKDAQGSGTASAPAPKTPAPSAPAASN